MFHELLRLIDAAAEILPQNRVLGALPQIVGHRGGSGPGTKENTLDSFVACRDAGVWGIECDVQWTKDNVPVVLHDPTPERVFRNHVGAVSQLEFSRLRSQLKNLPTLAEVVEAVSGKCHLMIEVKQPLNQTRVDSLQQALGRLLPVENFHLLTLHPEYLASTHQIPRQAFVFVSELHPLQASRYVLENKWGGIGGHYLLLHPKLRARHHAAGQLVGVGFINGINNLYRQMRLKADWIFSDQAVQLHQQAMAYLDRSNGAS